MIGLGVLLFLREADVVPADVTVWPVVILGAGVFLLVTRIADGAARGAGLLAPLALVTVGAAFLLEDLGVFVDDGLLLLPIAVIAVGVGLILAAIPSSRRWG